MALATNITLPFGGAPGPQQLDRGDEQGVVGQRAEELRRHDRVEASFHAARNDFVSSP
jgi:hypothetical protein